MLQLERTLLTLPPVTFTPLPPKTHHFGIARGGKSRGRGGRFALFGCVGLGPVLLQQREMVNGLYLPQAEGQLATWKCRGDPKDR